MGREFNMGNSKIILASKSPRRKELLRLITENFEICVPNVAEIMPKEIPATEFPEYIACKKALAVSLENPSFIVIGADTAVFVGDKILGKPQTPAEAYSMLKSLSGKTHKVITGCAIFCGKKSLSFSVETDVEFFALSDSEINDYIATNEPFDKAGGYGIQSKGSLFIKKINGDYFNVVGLPISTLSRYLQDF